MNELTCATVMALALVAGACDTDPPEPRFGVDVLGLVYDVTDDKEGVYPNDAVLGNPDNPFRFTAISIEARFALLGEGTAVASFYAWATQLAREPTGESQFFAALSLERIYQAGAITDESELDTVRLMAIAGGQSVLDNFPDGVTFDETGTVPSRLATPAYLLIERLGGQVQGDWVLVSTPDGGQQAVRGSEGDEP